VTFLKKYLQTTEADAEGENAHVVSAFEQFPVGFFLLQAIHQAGDHDQARRHVDVEDVFPAPVFREPATDGRADRGRERRGHGEHGHAFGAVVFREFDQRQGKRQRDQRAAGEALQGTEDDHALQAPGHRAQQRGGEKTQ